MLLAKKSTEAHNAAEKKLKAEKAKIAALLKSKIAEEAKNRK
jgi:hypothetical protein